MVSEGTSKEISSHWQLIKWAGPLRALFKAESPCQPASPVTELLMTLGPLAPVNSACPPSLILTFNVIHFHS